MLGNLKTKVNISELPQEAIFAKALALLGFAQKANKVVSGDDSVFSALGKKKIHLFILAEDLSENSKAKFLQKLHSTARSGKKGSLEIPCYTLGKKVELGLAIGKSPRGLVAIIDENFAKGLIGYLKELDGNKGVV